MRLATTLTLALLAAPAAAAAPHTGFLGNRVAGEARRCIILPRNQPVQVITGQAIVYQDGSTWWVNRPVSGAERLRFDDLLIARTVGARLCRADRVGLRSRNARVVAASVTLGDFVPYTLRNAPTGSVQP
jgi:hypothetical protein